MQPLPMSIAEFTSARMNMKGFGELRKTYQCSQLNLSSDSGDVAEVITERIHRTLTMHSVQGVGSQELMFAGVIRKTTSNDRALLTVVTTE